MKYKSAVLLMAGEDSYWPEVAEVRLRIEGSAFDQIATGFDQSIRNYCKESPIPCEVKLNHDEEVVSIRFQDGIRYFSCTDNVGPRVFQSIMQRTLTFDLSTSPKGRVKGY